jgi:hypothetical protein
MIKTVQRQDCIGEIITQTRHIFQCIFTDLFEETRKVNKTNKYILKEFQLSLKGIKERDVLTLFDLVGLQSNVDRIVIANSELFGSALYKVKAEDFIFEVLMNIAREIWCKPIIFYHRVSKQEYIKNMMIVEKIVTKAIKTTVRRLSGPLRLPEPPSLRILPRSADELSRSADELSRSADELPRSADELPRSADELSKFVDGLPESVEGVYKCANGLPTFVDGTDVEGLPQSIHRVSPSFDEAVRSILASVVVEKSTDVVDISQPIHLSVDRSVEIDDDESSKDFDSSSSSSSSSSAASYVEEKVKRRKKKNKRFKKSSLVEYKNYLDPDAYMPRKRK